MYIFLNMNFFDGVLYGGNWFVCFYDKICIQFKKHINYKFHIIWKPNFLVWVIFNILLGIGIPELLLNLVSYNERLEKPNSTVILNCWYYLVNNYLSKGLYIIEKDSKKKGRLLNDVKFIINVIYQLDTDFFMAKNKAISSVANTPSKQCIFREICIWFTNKTSLRINKRKYMNFYWKKFPIMESLDNPELIG